MGAAKSILENEGVEMKETKVYVDECARLFKGEE